MLSLDRTGGLDYIDEDKLFSGYWSLLNFSFLEHWVLCSCDFTTSKMLFSFNFNDAIDFA